MLIHRKLHLLTGVLVTLALALTAAPVDAAHASVTESESQIDVGQEVVLNIAFDPANDSLWTSASASGFEISTPGPLTGVTLEDLNKLENATDFELSQPALAPVIIWVLRLVVQRGIPLAIKIAGRTAVKKAFKQKLLARNGNTWHHIFQKKHNWGKFNAQGNRSKAADLLANAATKGKLVKNDNKVMHYRWVNQGKSITVAVSKITGEISDGWVH